MLFLSLKRQLPFCFLVWKTTARVFFCARKTFFVIETFFLCLKDFFFCVLKFFFALERLFLCLKDFFCGHRSHMCKYFFHMGNFNFYGPGPLGWHLRSSATHTPGRSLISTDSLSSKVANFIKMWLELKREILISLNRVKINPWSYLM